MAKRIFMKFKPFIGPKLYQFKDPDTGYEYNAPSMGELLKIITDYRRANALSTIEMLHRVVENFLCSLPIHRGDCEPDAHLQRSVDQYVKGGVALIKSLMYKTMVPQEVAERRAEQCVDCPFNKFPEKDGFQEASDAVALRLIGDRRTKHHNNLGNCMVCSCPLRAKVFYQGNFSLSEEETVMMKTVNCWQLQHKVPK